MDFESSIRQSQGPWDVARIHRLHFNGRYIDSLLPTPKLEHFEFLAEDERDPPREFIESLCGILESADTSSFTMLALSHSVFVSCAAWLPEYKERIKSIKERLWDCGVREEHVYHPEISRIVLDQIRSTSLVPKMA